MPVALEEVELAGCAGAGQSLVQPCALPVRYQHVAGAVGNLERRSGRAYPVQGVGLLGEVGPLGGVPAQQPGFWGVRPIGPGEGGLCLGDHRGQIHRSVRLRHRLHGGVPVGSLLPRKIGQVAGEPGQRGQMPPGRGPPHPDCPWVQAKPPCGGAQEANRGPDVVELSRKQGLTGEPVLDTRHGHAGSDHVLSEVWSQGAVTGEPAPTMQPDDYRHGGLSGGRAVEVQQQVTCLALGEDEIGIETDGNLGTIGAARCCV